MKTTHFQFFIIAVTVFLTTGCAKENIPRSYSYTPPQLIPDGLSVSTLDSVGLNTGLIEYMIDQINSNRYVNLHSVLIIKEGKLVLEEYFQGYDKNTLNDTYSATKSICSALVGIAIDKQYIKSVDDPIKKYLSEYSDIDWTGKEDITIKHLLTMSAGLAWDESTAPYGSPENSHTKMNQSPDQVKYVLQRPVVDIPGAKFVYNSGLVVTLGKIIANSGFIDFDTLATRYLFAPLGIRNHQWYIYPSGIYLASGDLMLTSRDMAKFGLLYLNNGKWNGQQIISEKWVKQSSESYISPWHETYYGYLWWKMPLLLLNGQRIEGYFAEGYGGQLIFILPSYKMVVVFTSGINWNKPELTFQPLEILQQFILPGIKKY